MSLQHLKNIARDMKEGIEIHLNKCKTPFRRTGFNTTQTYVPSPRCLADAYSQKERWQAKVIEEYMIPETELHRELKEVVFGFRRIQDYFTRKKDQYGSLSNDDFQFLIGELERILPVAQRIEDAVVSEAKARNIQIF